MRFDCKKESDSSFQSPDLSELFPMLQVWVLEVWNEIFVLVNHKSYLKFEKP